MKKVVLQKDVFTYWRSLKKDVGRIEDEIVNRISYVWYTINNAFGNEVDTWYFDDAGEGEVGNLDIDDSFVSSIQTDYKKKSTGDMAILLKDGSEFGFYSEFPTRWLFEDFEQELIEGKKKYEEQEVARKEAEKIKRQRQKAKTLVLADQAKLKLSKEELAALKKIL